MTDREVDAIIWKHDRRLAQDLRLFPIPFDELRALEHREAVTSFCRAVNASFPTAEEALWSIAMNLWPPQEET